MSFDKTELERAPFVEHLSELRKRMMRILWVIGVFFAACLFFSDDIFNLLLRPFEAGIGNIADVRLIYTAPQEFFITQVKLALFGAVFLSFPFMASQIYAFTAPGLYKNERQVFLPFVVFGPLLFLLGAAMVYFLVMPAAMRFFLSYEQLDHGLAKIHLVPRVSEYLSLVMSLVLAFGFCFQLPIILALLAYTGLVNSKMLRSGRRYAVVLIFIVAAIMTPPDPMSQVILALPLIFLYEISVIAVSLIESRNSS